MSPAQAERPPWIAGPHTRRHRLPSGDLWIAAGPGEPYSVHELCDFAARRNPRRGFLFVSTVLGRYLPVRPARLDDPVTHLAARLPADLPGPVVFVGVAAAGVAIAHRLWARFVDRTARDDSILITSTRHHFGAPVAYAFDEPHSHARRHRMHHPLDATADALFGQARSVVIVDDEVTSGRTVTELIAAHHRRFPCARTFVHAVLTDWTNAPLDAGAPPGCTISLIAAARGVYHFEADPDFIADMPDVTGERDPRWHELTPGHPRFGRRTPLRFDDLGPQLPAVRPGERALVLGTGEAQYAAFLIAEHWAAAGVRAQYQCIVRAPVLPGGPIGRVLTFDDPYGEGIPNYLYNFDRARFDRVVLCREGPCRPQPALIDALGAELLDIEPADG